MRASRRLAMSALALVFCSSGVAWSGLARAHAPTKNIYSFPSDGIANSGAPSSDLTADRSGNLYGVRPSGGSSSGCGCGTIYRLAPPTGEGKPWTEKTLYSFSGGSSGNRPLGKPLLDAVGNVYGTTYFGGTIRSGRVAHLGKGTVWKLSPPTIAGGQWTFTVLYAFSNPGGDLGGADGAWPVTGLAMDRAGTLYGTASYGGMVNRGVVFSLAPPAVGSKTWIETVLHSFGARRFGGRLDGIYPDGPLTLSANQRTLTGVTSGSGYSRQGAVYRLRRQGSSWSFTVIASGCCGGGERPRGSLVIDRNDNLFGVTQNGGPNGNFGTVFELSPPAPGQTTWAVQLVHSFSGPDGEHPVGGLVAGGLPTALFGTTSLGGSGSAVDGSSGSDGVVFRLDPPASGSGPWTYTVLHAFAAGQSSIGGAGYIQNGLTFGPNGFLFAVATYGGLYGQGAVFAQTPH